MRAMINSAIGEFLLTKANALKIIKAGRFPTCFDFCMPFGGLHPTAQLHCLDNPINGDHIGGIAHIYFLFLAHF